MALFVSLLRREDSTGNPLLVQVERWEGKEKSLRRVLCMTLLHSFILYQSAVSLNPPHYLTPSPLSSLSPYLHMFPSHSGPDIGLATRTFSAVLRLFDVRFYRFIKIVLIAGPPSPFPLIFELWEDCTNDGRMRMECFSKWRRGPLIAIDSTSGRIHGVISPSSGECSRISSSHRYAAVFLSGG